MLLIVGVLGILPAPLHGMPSTGVATTVAGPSKAGFGRSKLSQSVAILKAAAYDTDDGFNPIPAADVVIVFALGNTARARSEPGRALMAWSRLDRPPKIV